MRGYLATTDTATLMLSYEVGDTLDAATYTLSINVNVGTRCFK